MVMYLFILSVLCMAPKSLRVCTKSYMKAVGNKADLLKREVQAVNGKKLAGYWGPASQNQLTQGIFTSHPED
jgi:hypothetical protein